MSDFTIKPGRMARTLDYQDALGIITISFDFDASKTPPVVVFDRPSKSIIDSEQARIDFVLEKSKEYFASRGFSIRVAW